MRPLLQSHLLRSAPSPAALRVFPLLPACWPWGLGGPGLACPQFLGLGKWYRSWRLGVGVGKRKELAVEVGTVESTLPLGRLEGAEQRGASFGTASFTHKVTNQFTMLHQLCQFSVAWSIRGQIRPLSWCSGQSSLSTNSSCHHLVSSRDHISLNEKSWKCQLG